MELFSFWLWKRGSAGITPHRPALLLDYSVTPTVG